jgi:type I restriction enzyme R subunit
VQSHYVSEGVDELDAEKLTPLLLIRYQNSISEAVADLGKPDDIKKALVGFQGFLNQKAA